MKSNPIKTRKVRWSDMTTQELRIVLKKDGTVRTPAEQAVEYRRIQEKKAMKNAPRGGTWKFEDNKLCLCGPDGEVFGWVENGRATAVPKP